MDFLIDALLRIEEDCFFKVAQKQRMGIVNQQEIKELHRHQRGLQIKPEDVTVRNDLLYLSFSSLGILQNPRFDYIYTHEFH